MEFRIFVSENDDSGIKTGKAQGIDFLNIARFEARNIFAGGESFTHYITSKGFKRFRIGRKHYHYLSSRGWHGNVAINSYLLPGITACSLLVDLYNSADWSIEEVDNEVLVELDQFGNIFYGDFERIVNRIQEIHANV